MRTMKLTRRTRMLNAWKLFGIVLLLSAFAQNASATIVHLMTADAPLNTGGLGRFAMIITYANAGSNLVLDSAYTGDPTPPEGDRVLKTTLSTSWGGWGFLNTSVANNANYVWWQDFTGYENGSIRFWLKSDSTLTLEVKFVGMWGDETRPYNIPSTGGVWKPMVVPMSSFAPGIDFSYIRCPFLITAPDTPGAKTWSVDDVKWDSTVPGALASIQIATTPAVVPLGFQQVFIALGYDSVGRSVDILPTWSAGSLGTFNRTAGGMVRFFATNTPSSGNLTATYSGVTGLGSISVQNVNFTQYNVYSDIGAGGYVGASPAGGNPILTEITDASAPEGTKYMRATYYLATSLDWSVWYVSQQDYARYMKPYENGYLRFNVRSTKNLLVKINSNNIPAGTEQSKINLDELGFIPNGQWQDIIVPMALFKVKEPNLDFTQIKTYFTIGTLYDLVGAVPSGTFDVDNVRWLTTSQDAPDPAKVLQGLVEKQNSTTGLLASFDTVNQAVTYDQALAAMAFTFSKDFTHAQNIFNAYQSLYSAGQGFADTYRVDTKAVLDNDRLCGPNGWMLLALIHYRNVSGSTAYDTMIDGLAAWLKGYQDSTDGGIKFGNPVNAGEINVKSTEHNFDVYAAFRAYAMLRGNAAYNTAADQIMGWINSTAWNAAEKRFNVGEFPAGGADTDKALDAYSWAPLALGVEGAFPYATVLANAETTFGTTKVNSNNGNAITGYDFGAAAGVAPDKDSVWLEGTGQMAMAYLAIGNETKANAILDQLRRAVFSVSPTAQGMTYATNMGTAYGGWMMDATNAAISPAAWYLFTEWNFNPFRPYFLHSVTVKNVSDNSSASEMSWLGVNARDGWRLAKQYIQLDAQPISKDPWGIQIYTDNKNASSAPQFVDPSPTNTTNMDSNPAGLLIDIPGQTTTYMTLPIAWSIKKDTTTAPVAANPNDNGINGHPTDSNSYQWLFMKDRGTPTMDGDGDGLTGGAFDITAFADGDRYIRVMQKSTISGARGSVHMFSGPVGNDFFDTLSPNFLFFESDFTGAPAQVTYRTKLTLEFFTE